MQTDFHHGLLARRAVLSTCVFFAGERLGVGRADLCAQPPRDPIVDIGPAVERPLREWRGPMTPHPQPAGISARSSRGVLPIWRAAMAIALATINA